MITIAEHIQQLESLINDHIKCSDGFETMLKNARNVGELEDIKKEQLWHLERAGYLHEKKLKLIKQLH